MEVSDRVYLPSVVNFSNVKINFLPSLRRDKNNRVFRWNLAQTNVYSIAGEEIKQDKTGALQIHIPHQQ